ENLADLFALVGVHLEQAADALGFPARGAQHAVAGLELAGINADECQLSDEWISHDLESQTRKWLFVIGFAYDFLFRMVGIGAFGGRNIQWRWQVVDHRIQ